MLRKPEGKRPIGRHGCGWEDNSKIRFQIIGWERVDWINVAQLSKNMGCSVFINMIFFVSLEGVLIAVTN